MDYFDNVTQGHPDDIEDQCGGMVGLVLALGIAMVMTVGILALVFF